MEELKSISQACFVSLPRKTKPNKLVRSTEQEIGRRYTIFRETWEYLESEVLRCQAEAHTDVLNSVMSFVQSHNPALTEASQRLDIPVAALMMGVNMSDHNAVFDLLATKLHTSVTRMVARLHAKDCNSIAAMIQKVVMDIMQRAGSEDAEVKRTACTMSMLAEWHESAMVKIPGSPSKRQKKSFCGIHKEDPIIVILEDLEGFKVSALQDFILICSKYLEKLPIVLIFGVSTTVMAIHNMIPQSASSCLAIETFFPMPVTEYLSQVFEKVLLESSISFKLGHAVFQFIVDVVLFHDFSLTNLLQMLKMCMFEHFYHNPASHLCCRQEELKDVLQGMSQMEMNDVLGQPSYQRYLMNNKLSSETTSKRICRMVKDLHSHHKNSLLLLHVLYEFAKKLPGCSLGNHLREVYMTFLQAPVCETEEFSKLVKLIRVMSIDELQKRIGDALSILESHKDLSQAPTSIAELKTHLVEYVEKFTALTGDISEAQDASETAEPVVLEWGKLRSRSQFQEKLKSLTKTKRVSPFEALRDEFSSFFAEAFSNLKPSTSMPLHEVLYYNDAAALKQYFTPSPRTVLHAALARPQTILMCECCRNTSSCNISASLPDLSISYKLHLEGGKLINLYDMMQSFKSVKSGEKKLSAQEEKITEAQFFRSIAELQFLGLVKPTLRKTDHVQRMTWGFC
ncbi:origin recognition complex subunit 3 isoform X1 [Dermacentor variabilis]|uniref:origin recognition complex subunit 3 isoform X1 n=2 Tax=Dermacentor variabilis TaxID=34621 RepID=UPI003F5B0298